MSETRKSVNLCRDASTTDPVLPVKINASPASFVIPDV